MRYSRVQNPDQEEEVVQHKRHIIVTKARNGIGEWNQVACDLDPTTLRFKEYGVIVGKADSVVQLDADPQF